MADRYRVGDISGICHHLQSYRGRTDEWKAEFLNMEGKAVCNFEGDEETIESIMDDDSLYAMVTEMIDFTMMMMGDEFDL